MSDVGLHFTWYQLVLFALVIAFWPITLATALAVLWVWRQRSSRWARVALGITATPWLLALGTMALAQLERVQSNGQEDASMRARTRTLAHAEVIDRLRLPAGTKVTVEDGPSPDLQQIELPVAAMIGGAPLVGRVYFTGGEVTGEATLARAATVDAVPCSPAETVTFQSGQLTGCALVKPSRIRGVPCGGRVDVQIGIVCTLASDYRRFEILWRVQTKVTDYGSNVWFRIGPNAPSLQVLGQTLRADSEVAFQSNALSSIDLSASPLRYRDCTIELVLIENGGTFGQARGVCDLPRSPSVGYIPLPAGALRR